MNPQDWLELFQNPVDVIGSVLFLLLFSAYHAAYPWLIRRFPYRMIKARFDLYRRSWIEDMGTTHGCRNC